MMNNNALVVLKESEVWVYDKGQKIWGSEFPGKMVKEVEHCEWRDVIDRGTPGCVPASYLVEMPASAVVCFLGGYRLTAAELEKQQKEA